MPAIIYHIDLQGTEQERLEAIIKKNRLTSEIVKRGKILYSYQSQWGKTESTIKFFNGMK
ncbi:MAG: hypothetical protein AAGI07_14480 [Bacteroidota bacterium]